MENLTLGKWAVIDIETSGIDPSYDKIIDIGFLVYEGAVCVKKYQSLVRYDGELSQFIQKLTGISQDQAKNAPLWTLVEPELLELEGHHLLAHNAAFEESFLSPYFTDLGTGGEKESYEDSLFYLALLFPGRSSLKLEGLIQDFNIRESEVHRGFEDSVDLLKVLLAATAWRKKDPAFGGLFTDLIQKYQLQDWWYAKFYLLSDDEIEALALSVNFNIEGALEYYLQNQQEELPLSINDPQFDLKFNGANIKSIFEKEDIIKERLPHYKARPAQQELSLRTGQSFKNNVHSLIQAPTGTGKTLGYLIPSSLFAIDEGKQVLVSTGTKTLQHQAISKDVPQLRSLLGLGPDQLRVKRLIGSNNHLCESIFRQTEGQEDLLLETRSFEEKLTDFYFDLVFFTNGQNTGERQILRDDLPYVLKAKWPKFKDKDGEIAVDFRSCTGAKCPFKGECTYINGLREAKDAHIIIGNHALMFSWPKGFPRPAHIVVDEAHKIEEETTRAFTMEIAQHDLEQMAKQMQHLQGIGSLFYLLAQVEESEGQSTEIINELRNESIKTSQILSDHLNQLPLWVESYFKKMPRYTDKYWNELPMINPKNATDELGLKIVKSLESLHFVLSHFEQLLVPILTKLEGREFREDGEVIARTRLDKFMGQLSDMVMTLKSLLELQEGYSHSLKYHERDGLLIQSAPIDVGRILHDQLLSPSSSVVFTSATLGNANGDQGVKGVEWATGYSYLDPERRFKRGFFLPSVYDYSQKTKVFLCDDTLPLYDSNFVPQTLDPILEVIKKLNGRSLLLFSAKQRFEVAREVLLKEFEGKIPLYIQGMGNNVVEEFKNNGEGILLGMESFGEGIDVPGEALQFVFIDKIPDLRQDLVINQRRQFYDSNLGNEFTDYYLAHRTRSLQQKLGRLLRTESDHGGVIIVDRRIRRWKGNTLEKLRRLMEPYEINLGPLDDACKQVVDFIQEHPI